MKSNFSPKVNLQKIEEELTAKKDILTISLGSSGLNNKGEDIHKPVRLDAILYHYNEKEDVYTEHITFSKLVYCGDEAYNEAVKNADNNGYDAFRRNGIDRDKYKAQEGVLSVTDFKNELDFFINSIDVENTSVIVNGLQFTKDMLKTIGCENAIRNLDNENHNIIDAVKITSELFEKNNVTSKMVGEDTGRIKNTLDYGLLYIKGYLDEQHKNFALKGGLAKCRAMYDIASYEARKKGILPDNVLETLKIEDMEMMKAMSDKGKAEYAVSPLADKFEYFLEKKIISPEVADRNYPCDLNNLLDALDETKTPEKKGFIILQVATSGFNAKDLPIQCGVAVLERKNGTLVPAVNQKGEKIAFYHDVAVSEDVRKAMDRQMNAERNPFDAYKYTGIDRERYIQGLKTQVFPNGNNNEKLISGEELNIKLKEIFDKYPTDQYTLVTLGTNSKSNISFSGNALKKIGNLAQYDLKKPDYIDFSKVIYEYSFAKFIGRNDIPKNVIIKDIENLEKFNFALDNVALNQDKPRKVDQTLRKCVFVAQLVKRINEQQKELEQSYGKDALEKILAEDYEKFTKEHLPNERGIITLDKERERLASQQQLSEQTKENIPEQSIQEVTKNITDNDTVYVQPTAPVHEEQSEDIQAENTNNDEKINFSLYGSEVEFQKVDVEKDHYIGKIIIDINTANKLFSMSTSKGIDELKENIFNTLKECVADNENYLSQNKIEIPVLSQVTKDDLYKFINNSNYNYNELANDIIADCTYMMYADDNTYNTDSIKYLADIVRDGKDATDTVKDIFSVIGQEILDENMNEEYEESFQEETEIHILDNEQSKKQISSKLSFAELANPFEEERNPEYDEPKPVLETQKYRENIHPVEKTLEPIEPAVIEQPQPVYEQKQEANEQKANEQKEDIQQENINSKSKIKNMLDFVIEEAEEMETKNVSEQEIKNSAIDNSSVTISNEQFNALLSRLDTVISENKELTKANAELIARQNINDERIDKLIQVIEAGTQQNAELALQNKLLAQNIKDVTENLVNAYTTTNDAHLSIIQDLANQNAMIALQQKNMEQQINKKAEYHETTRKEHISEKAIDFSDIDDNVPANIEGNVSDYLKKIIEKQGLTDTLSEIQKITANNQSTIDVSERLGVLVYDLATTKPLDNTNSMQKHLNDYSF